MNSSTATRIRRRFWTKVVVLNLLVLTVLVAVASLVRDDWFERHKFAVVILGIAGLVSFIAVGAAWRFNEPCPSCGWNLNQSKEPSGWPVAFVPSICPNCGMDLEKPQQERHPTSRA